MPVGTSCRSRAPEPAATNSRVSLPARGPLLSAGAGASLTLKTWSSSLNLSEACGSATNPLTKSGLSNFWKTGRVWRGGRPASAWRGQWYQGATSFQGCPVFMPHQMLPAPCEYRGEVTDVAVNGVQVTLPENVDDGALTVSPAGALIVTLLTAVIVTLPPASNFITQPLLCCSTTSEAPSSSTSFRPLLSDRVTLACPSVSSNSSRLPERVLMSRLLFGSAGDSGRASRPFHAEPTMYGR